MNSSTFSTPVISRIVWLLIPFFSVFLLIMRNSLIPVVCNFLLYSFLKAQHSSPHHKALFTQLLYILPFSFSDTALSRSTLAISLNFFHPHLILAVTASCTPPLESKKHPYLVSLLHQQRYYPLNHNIFCTQNLLHRIDTFSYQSIFYAPKASYFSSTYCTEHRNLKVFIATVLSPVQKPLLFSHLRSNLFLVIDFFYRAYLHFYFFSATSFSVSQLSPSTKSSA